MKKLWKHLQSFNLTILLAWVLFFIIATILTLTTVISWILISRGIVRFDHLVHPVHLIGFLFFLCLLIVIVVMAVLRSLVLSPLHNMVDDMKRLSSGDFSVRIKKSRKMSPRELREFADSFNKAAEELGSLELLRKDFINNFAHEFKTPITSLGGFAELILEDVDMCEEERREYLSIISQESRRLAMLSNSVLALSRLEAQTCLSNSAPFNLTEQLRQTLLMIDQKWADKNIEFELEADECIYHGNEALLKEVWVNLLDNAAKFSPQNSKVNIRLTHKYGVTVEISDFGQGMDEKTLHHIFDQFYQGDSSHQIEGNGLGLTLVKKIVTLHNGEIHVESQIGSGSKFTVNLPQ